jgi:hypothetical protein
LESKQARSLTRLEGGGCRKAWDSISLLSAMQKKKIVRKPVRKQRNDPAFDWGELQEWVKYKTGKDVRDWAGKFSKKEYDDLIPYQDFWHILTDTQEIHNGGYFYLSLREEDYEENFAKEIVRLLAKEFPKYKNGDMYCYVYW